jgi:ABC-type Fe3+-hydroxamate transport system substrate-binding protein
MIQTYKNFQSRAELVKNNFLEFLLMQKKKKKKVIAYGAAAKGNTLLNFAGIKTDLIQYVVDAAEAKQNKFMPGSHIPIVSPENLNNIEFDYIVILPWNLSNEIYNLLKDRVKNETQFVTAIPELKIFS